MTECQLNPAPTVGITCDIADGRHCLTRTYIDAVARAGGVPMMLPPPGEVSEADATEIARTLVALCDAIVLSGGDDPRTEPFGVPTHPKANPVHPDRQRFETAILAALHERPDMPILGVCLGMQMMALVAGGTLNQYMPDTTPTHADHWDDHEHPIITCIQSSPLGEDTTSDAVLGRVTSRHRQAVSDPGSLRVIARAQDGIIEAIDAPNRPFFVGVQWHPERTVEHRLGRGLFDSLVVAACSATVR